jgi:hypothetical protein
MKEKGGASEKHLPSPTFLSALLEELINQYRVLPPSLL